MRAVLWFLLGVATLGVLSTFLIESSYAARAQRVQWVRMDPTQHNPLGPVTVDVGEPVKAIISDPKALLKDKTPLGLPMLDVDYLKRHPTAVLTLESVDSIARLARIGCTVSGIFALAGLILLKKGASLPIPAELQ